MTSAIELAAALHARFLAMLESYVDESTNVRTKPRIFVVAGWLGDAPAWREFEEKWKKVVDTEGIKEFKSADCLGGYGEFERFTEEQRRALRWQLVEAIKASRLLGVTSAYTFDETAGPIKQRRDYWVGLYSCMSSLAAVSNTYPVGERVAFLVDDRKKGAGYLEAVRRTLRKDDDQLGLGHRIGPAAFDDSVEILGLQAADLLAHEGYLQRLNEIEKQPSRQEYVAIAPRIWRDVAHWDQATRNLFDYYDPDDPRNSDAATGNSSTPTSLRERGQNEKE
jgi:hypothetical protein